MPSLTAALQGLAAGPAHVRAAALHALFSDPAVEEGAVPDDDEVLALLWLARCDPSETNAEVGFEWRLFALVITPYIMQ